MEHCIALISCALPVPVNTSMVFRTGQGRAPISPLIPGRNFASCKPAKNRARARRHQTVTHLLFWLVIAFACVAVAAFIVCASYTITKNRLRIMDANDQRLIEGLFARIDRLVAIMEGKYCPETSGETWLRAEELLKLPQFRHRKGRVWLYELAKTSPDIMKKDCLPHQKRGATLWCVERISKAMKENTAKILSFDGLSKPSRPHGMRKQ